MAGYGSFLGGGLGSIGEKVGENISNFDKDSRGFIKKNPWALGATGYGMKAAGLLDNPSIGLSALSEPTKAFGGLAGNAIGGLAGAGKGKDFLSGFLGRKGLLGGIAGGLGKLF
tara:strand:+ start:111 stop:452 length:342 start_codon:yes stop_codon:yes gene_type:complete